MIKSSLEQDREASIILLKNFYNNRIDIAELPMPPNFLFIFTNDSIIISFINIKNKLDHNKFYKEDLLKAYYEAKLWERKGNGSLLEGFHYTSLKELVYDMEIREMMNAPQYLYSYKLC